MNAFYKLPNFVTEIERKNLLSKMNDTNFINHKSTKTGRYSPLNFLFINYRGIEKYTKVAIMKMLPNAIQDWHRDGKHLKRCSVLIHPLSHNYAPIHTVDGPVCSTGIFNTQSPHAVFNNTSHRLNLQIYIDANFDNLMEDKNSKWWELIWSLYD